jgi:hypothetical protein
MQFFDPSSRKYSRFARCRCPTTPRGRDDDRQAGRLAELPVDYLKYFARPMF